MSTKASQSTRKAKGARGRITILNWMLTLLISALPGINIIYWIVTLIVDKHRSKRTFAAASLIWTGIIVVLFIAAFMIFGAQLVEFADKLAVPAATIPPMP